MKNYYTIACLKMVLLCTVSLLFLRCEMEPVAPSGLDAVAFNTLVRNSAEFMQPEELEVEREAVGTPTMESETRTMMMPGGVMRTEMYTCTTQMYKAAPGYNELFLLNPTFDIIYPGSIIDGASIADGRYLPILAPRKPMRISTSIIGSAEAAGATVQNPSLSNIRQAFVPLLSQDNTAGLQPPANIVLSVRELYNSREFSLALGVNIMAQVTPTIAAGLGASFGIETSTRRHSYITRFAHRYFSVDVDLPANPSDFFEEYPNIPSGAVPVYVSSVSYGRMVLFNMKSSSDSTEIKAAIELPH